MNMIVSVPLVEKIARLVEANTSDFMIRLHCAGSKLPELELTALIAEARALANKPDPTTMPQSAYIANIAARQYVWTDPEKIPMREWLYGKRLIRKFVSATIAPGAVGKSSLLIAETLAMVSGHDLLGVQSEMLRVWYYGLEDPADETTRLIQAAAKFYDLAPDDADIGDRLFVNSGRDQPLVIAKMEDRYATICYPVIEALVEQIKRNGIDVLIIDPFVSCHTIPENDNGAIDMVVKEWGRVADLGDCAVELVHHVKKGESEITTESARGAGAFSNACRNVRTLNRMTEEEARKAGVDNRRLYFRAYSDKVNMAPPVETSDWFKLVSVELGNNGFGTGGDDVGVVTKWEWPDLMAGVTGADFLIAAHAIRTGNWRESIQAKDWVGVAVARALDLDLNVKADRAKVVAMLRAWFGSGALEVVEREDSSRHVRKFVRVRDDEN